MIGHQSKPGSVLRPPAILPVPLHSGHTASPPATVSVPLFRHCVCVCVRECLCVCVYVHVCICLRTLCLDVHIHEIFSHTHKCTHLIRSNCFKRVLEPVFVKNGASVHVDRLCALATGVARDLISSTQNNGKSHVRESEEERARGSAFAKGVCVCVRARARSCACVCEQRD